MCAPGSKAWKHRKRWLQLWWLGAACAFVFWSSVQHIIACEVRYLVDSEMDYLMYGAVPLHAQSKSYASEEAMYEITGAQEYVAALAAHDMAHSGSVYITAAFDLAADDPDEVAQGLLDWQAFVSPTQQHLHTLTVQWPTSWVSVADWAHATLLGTHLQHVLETIPAPVHVPSQFPEGLHMAPGAGADAASYLRAAAMSCAGVLLCASRRDNQMRIPPSLHWLLQSKP